MASVAQALRRAAQANPDGPACVTYREDGLGRATTTTNATLLETTKQIAHAIPRWTLGPGQQRHVIAMLCRNHELALAYLFAAAEAGCIAAPLNTRWGASEAAAALADCDPAVIVCDADLWPLLHAALSTISPGHLLSLKVVVILYAEEPLSRGEMPFAHSRVPVCVHHEEALRLDQQGKEEEEQQQRYGGGGVDDDVQCLVYTSGSTGEPKGVMLSHSAQLMQAAEKVRLGRYDSSAVYLSLAPLFHVAGLNSSVAVTMAGGTHVFLQPPGGPRGLGPPRLAVQAMAAHRVNTLVVVPAMLAALLDALEDEGGVGTTAAAPSPQQAAVVRESVGFVLVGGQALAEGLWRRASAALPLARIVQSYACSEACSSITFLEISPNAPFPPAGLVGAATQPNLEVAVLALNDETDEPGEAQRQRKRRAVCAPGQTGEIATRGPHLMRGYWRNPRATATALVEVDGRGKGPWLCTGDVGSLDAEGRLWVAGRLADVIRSGGEKVMAAEVERALLAHPSVSHAAVVGAADARLGERVVAFVVLRRDGSREVDGEGLRQICRGRLAGYKVPKEVRVVASLPMTASGKVMKGRLRREVAEGQERSFL